MKHGAKVLVTGSSGFIGTALARHLRTVYDCQVTGVDIVPGPETTHHYDVCDLDGMERLVVSRAPTVVFHLAAISQVTDASRIPFAAFFHDALGTVSVLEALRRHQQPGTSTVISTTDKVYGDIGHIGAPRAEGDGIRPYHPYDAAKASADLMAICYGHRYAMNIMVLRMCNVYGWGDRNWKRLVPSVMADAFKGRPPELRSDGKQHREYVYIDDALRALVLAADFQGEAQAFNIGGDGRTVEEVCEEVQAAMALAGWPSPAPRILNQAHDESSSIRLDSSKAARILGWTPSYSLRDGIARTVAGLTALVEKTRESQWNALMRLME